MEMPMTTPKEIPPGFIFKPTDAELVSHYLYKKINGEYFTSWNYIKDGNIYGEEAPSHHSKLFEGSSSDELYFFAKVKKKHNKSIGKKIERRAGNGTWVIKTPTTKVYDKNDKSHVIGYKAYLKFIVKSPQQALEIDKIKKPQCQWQMYEYKLKDVLFTPENKGNDSKLVVCVIKKGKLLSTSDNPPSPSLSERTWTDDEFNRPYKKHTGHRSPSLASKTTAYNEGLVQQEGKEKLLDSSDDSPSLLPPIMPEKWGKSSMPYKKHTRRRSPSLESKMTAYNEKLVQQKGKEKLLDSSDDSPSPPLPPFMPGKWGKSSMPYKKHTHCRSPPLASKATAYSEGLVQQKGKEKLLDISDDSPSPPPPIMPGKWGKSSMPYKKHTRSRSSCAARGAPTPAPTTISKSDVDCIDELPQPWS